MSDSPAVMDAFGHAHLNLQSAHTALGTACTMVKSATEVYPAISRPSDKEALGATAGTLRGFAEGIIADLEKAGL